MTEEQIDEVTVQHNIVPLNVIYCGVCGIPPEYCEFGSSADLCLRWLSDNHPDLFEQIQNSQKLISKNNNRNVPTEEGKEENKNAQGESQNLEEKGNDDSDDEEKDGETKNKKERKTKKKKENKKAQTPSTSAPTRAAEQKVVISLVARTKRKQNTVISGLESFPDIKLKNVAKVLGKKFSSGCSVTETAGITIQGDFTDTLPEILMSEFNIPSRAISIVRETASAAPEEEEN